MKKILLFAATVTMLFAACTNEDLVAPQTGAETTLEDGAVGFDVYVPGATAQTRAGRVNVMTTPFLQRTGFGIFGYQTDNQGYAPGTSKPNYMWNQQVFFNSGASGWYYSPLKYWPNETKNDSQNPAAGMANQPGSDTYVDKLSFFAYAPYVNAVSSNGRALKINSELETKEENTQGITYLSNEEGKINTTPITGVDAYDVLNDPKVAYSVAYDPNYSVDLLWGVAPAGGLTYNSVANGVTSGAAKNGVVTIEEGKPLINLIKPAVNTNLKFQFQHALARLGVKVVAAVDQVAAGGVFDYGNSKITIEEISIQGNYGVKGVLNMNNTEKNTSNWGHVVKGNTYANAIKLNAAYNSLAEHLRYDATKNPATGSKSQQTHTGVTTDLADAIQVSSIKDERYSDYTTQYVAGKLTYSPTTPYFGGATTNATKTYVPFHSGTFPGTTDVTYFYSFTADNTATAKKSYTEITLNAAAITYPNALVWKNVCGISSTFIKKISDATDMTTYASNTAYRKVGKTYTPTGQKPEVGDYVFVNGSNVDEVPTSVPAPTQDATRYLAKPNYFMVIPTNSEALADRTLKVKIIYYVSTTDTKLKDRIVYTKNEVEKDVVLPHLKNGVAYDLRLILGLTSVKVEADVADWVTTGAEVNLPQNISE